MKPAISLYSFNNYIANTGATLKQCIDKSAELGFKGLDILPTHVGNHIENLKFAKDLGNYIKNTGLQSVCYCVGADFINPEGGTVNSEVERLKKELELAASYGCLLMRHDATGGYKKEVMTKRGFDNTLPALVEGYTQVTEYAKSLGIKTCVENHGFFVQDSHRVEKLINSVGHNNFGALVDIGNFSCADEDNSKAVGVLAPYAFHVHAKDFHIKSGKQDFPGDGWFMSRGGNFLRGAILGHGDVAVNQCISILKRAEYNGYVCIEFEGLEDSLLAAKLGINNLNKYIAR